MNKVLPFSVLSFFVGLSAITALGAPRHNDNRLPQDRFTGAWRLASLEEPDKDGHIHHADCTGLLVFTRDGHMSVQVMYRNSAEASSTGPVQYVQGGYEASYGRYEINDDHSFTFHAEGALARSLVGKDLPRVYEFSGRQLIVKSPDPNEHWRVTWERY